MLNKYVLIPLQPSVDVWAWSVAEPDIFSESPERVMVGMKLFGGNLSILVIFFVVYSPAFFPSHNLAYIVPLSVLVIEPV